MIRELEMLLEDPDQLPLPEEVSPAPVAALPHSPPHKKLRQADAAGPLGKAGEE